jgi:hypothetical protein
MLSFIHIALASLALVCMALPFYLAYRDQKKTWCKSVCPRADFLQKVGRISPRKTAPKWMVGNKARKAVLGYFCMNLLFVTMSTIAVATGRIEPIERIRLLIVLELPWSLPQLVSFVHLPVWLSHLSYRILFHHAHVHTCRGRAFSSLQAQDVVCRMSGQHDDRNHVTES